MEYLLAPIGRKSEKQDARSFMFDFNFGSNSKKRKSKSVLSSTTQTPSDCDSLISNTTSTKKKRRSPPRRDQTLTPKQSNAVLEAKQRNSRKQSSKIIQGGWDQDEESDIQVIHPASPALPRTSNATQVPRAVQRRGLQPEPSKKKIGPERKKKSSKFFEEIEQDSESSGCQIISAPPKKPGKVQESTISISKKQVPKNKRRLLSDNDDNYDDDNPPDNHFNLQNIPPKRKKATYPPEEIDNSSESSGCQVLSSPRNQDVRNITSKTAKPKRKKMPLILSEDEPEPTSHGNIDQPKNSTQFRPPETVPHFYEPIANFENDDQSKKKKKRRHKHSPAVREDVEPERSDEEASNSRIPMTSNDKLDHHSDNTLPCGVTTAVPSPSTLTPHPGKKLAKRLLFPSNDQQPSVLVEETSKKERKRERREAEKRKLEEVLIDDVISDCDSNASTAVLNRVGTSNDEGGYHQEEPVPVPSPKVASEPEPTLVRSPKRKKKRRDDNDNLQVGIVAMDLAPDDQQVQSSAPDLPPEVTTAPMQPPLSRRLKKGKSKKQTAKCSTEQMETGVGVSPSPQKSGGNLSSIAPPRQPSPSTTPAPSECSSELQILPSPKRPAEPPAEVVTISDSESVTPPATVVESASPSPKKLRRHHTSRYDEWSSTKKSLGDSATPPQGSDSSKSSSLHQTLSPPSILPSSRPMPLSKKRKLLQKAIEESTNLKSQDAPSTYSLPTSDETLKNSEGEQFLEEETPPPPPPSLSSDAIQEEASVQQELSEPSELGVQMKIDAREAEYLQLVNADPTNLLCVQNRLHKNTTKFLDRSTFTLREATNPTGLLRICTEVLENKVGVGYVRIPGRTVLPLEMYPDRTVIYIVLEGTVTVKSTGSWYRQAESGEDFLLGKQHTVGDFIIVPKLTVYTLENWETGAARLAVGEMIDPRSDNEGGDQEGNNANSVSNET